LAIAKTVTTASVYGVADEIKIYTGEITHDESNYFEHDMNSYRGCVGVIVFLLEGRHTGCAIGVRIGSPPQLEPDTVNLTLKIHESPTLLTLSPNIGRLRVVQYSF